MIILKLIATLMVFTFADRFSLSTNSAEVRTESQYVTNLALNCQVEDCLRSSNITWKTWMTNPQGRNWNIFTVENNLVNLVSQLRHCFNEPTLNTTARLDDGSVILHGWQTVGTQTIHRTIYPENYISSSRENSADCHQEMQISEINEENSSAEVAL